MGITSLWKFLTYKDEEENNGLDPSARKFKPCKLEDLANSKPCVDTPMLLHKFLRGNGQTSYIVQIDRFIQDLRKHNIEPYFVFDGKHPDLKYTEKKKRDNQKKINSDKLEASREYVRKLKKESGFSEDRAIAVQVGDKAMDDEQYKAVELITKFEEDIRQRHKNEIAVTSEHIEEAKKAIERAGASWVVAPSEAEAHCATLNRLGISDFVITEDSDCIVLGAKRILRGIGSSTNREKEMQIVDVEGLLKDISCSREQLVEICILCKNDFNETGRLKGIGIETAYKHVCVGKKDYFNTAEMVVRAILIRKRLNSKRKRSDDDDEDVEEMMKKFNYAAVRKLFLDELNATSASSGTSGSFSV